MIDEKVLLAVAQAIAQADEQNGGLPFEALMAMGKHVREGLFDRARAAIIAYESAKPKEATDAMVAAGLAAALEFMRENGIDGLSPFADYPSPSVCIRRVHRAMLSAAGDKE